MAETQRRLACERYARFLVKSYLRWNTSEDLRDVSCVVSFHQPTIAQGKAFWPHEFIDLLRTQLLVTLEEVCGSSAAGWRPNVAVAMQSSSALKLEIWFEAFEVSRSSSARPRTEPRAAA
jgi:hypothetical protein